MKYFSSQEGFAYDNMFSKPPLDPNLSGDTKSVEVIFCIEETIVKLLGSLKCGEFIGRFDYEGSVWTISERDVQDSEEDLDDESFDEGEHYWIKDRLVSYWRHLNNFEENFKKSLDEDLRKEKAVR